MDNNINNHGTGGHDSKMMFLMMIFCGLPLIILLFSRKSTGGFNWFAIAAIGAFIAGHFWLMRRGHQNHQHQDDDKNHSHATGVDDNSSNDQSHGNKGSGCH